MSYLESIQIFPTWEQICQADDYDFAKVLPRPHKEDPVLTMAKYVSQNLTAAPDAGVFWSSSRGFSDSLESSIEMFLQKKALPLRTSPQSTLATLSTEIAGALQVTGPTLSLSTACTGAINALITADAYVHQGLCSEAVVGAADQGSTPFVRAAMDALRITPPPHTPPPKCRPFADRPTGMLTGDGAFACRLTSKPTKHSQYQILGYAQRKEQGTLTGIKGVALFDAITQALERAPLKPTEVDLILAHGTGTMQGDRVEWETYERFFRGELPVVIATKHLTGHLFSASAGQALGLLETFLKNPRLYSTNYDGKIARQPSLKGLKNVQTILVVSAAFGGMANALLLQRLLR